MDHRLIRQNARYILKGNLLSLWIPIIIVELIALPFNLLIDLIAFIANDDVKSIISNYINNC